MFSNYIEKKLNEQNEAHLLDTAKSLGIKFLEEAGGVRNET